jgi:regulator of sigma E protease
VLAGPFFNFIMAFICAVILIGMTGYMSSEVMEVQAGSPAMEAGIRAGDVILKADHASIHTFTDFRMHTALTRGHTLNVVLDRDGERVTVDVTPRLDEDGVYRIGIMGGIIERPGPLGTLVHAFYEVKSNINMVIKSLELMIQGQVSKDEVSGPIGIFNIIGESYSEAARYGLREVFLTLVDLILLLSANLGAMNLLPIPGLDGSKLIFGLIELIRGKPVPPEKEAIVNTIGLVLLLGLMVLLTFKDIRNLLGR